MLDKYYLTAAELLVFVNFYFSCVALLKKNICTVSAGWPLLVIGVLLAPIKRVSENSIDNPPLQNPKDINS